MKRQTTTSLARPTCTPTALAARTSELKNELQNGLTSRSRLGALALILALAACSGPNDTELLASARAHMAKHETEAARLQLKTLLQKAPDSGEARLLLGQVMHDNAEMAGAETELRRAMELGQSETAVLPLLADTLLALHKGPLLLQQYGRIELTEALPDAELKTKLAAAEAEGGNLDVAEQRLAIVLRRSPDFVPALLLRARLVAARGNTADALALVTALLARTATNATTNTEAWMLKAELLMRTNPTDTAPSLAAYQEALKLSPNQVAARSAVITLLLGKPDLAGAKLQWAALQKVAPKHPQTMFFEAVLADLSGDAKRTRELTQLLLRGAPDSLPVLLLAGQTELKLNSLAQAETLFSKAVQVAPKATFPRRQLAQTQLRTGQADKALLTLRPLLDATPPDVAALTLAAQAQLMLGDAKAADASFARAAKLKPNDPKLRTAQAMSHLAQGQDVAGFNELEAIASSDKGTSADMALISARLRANDLPGALKAVDVLAVKIPSQPLPDQLRGRIALQRKDTATARKSFESAITKDANYLPALAGLAALDLADKQPAAAKARFEGLLKRQPDSSAAMMALAEIGARTGAKPEETVQWLEQAIKASPSDATPRLLLIDLHLANHQIKPALASAQSAATALPTNVDLLDRVGRTQLLAGETQQAINTFNKLAGMVPKSALPQLRLADAYAAANNRAAMATAVKRAAEISPNLLTVQQARATLALKEDKLPQALAIAQAMQTQHPTEALGFAIEADIELRKKNWEAAAAALRKALTRNQPGESAPRLHAALLANKKPADAEKMATEWRKSHPDDLSFVLHLGDTAMAMGNPTAAEQYFREVIAKQPGNVLALNNLAYLLTVQSKPEGLSLAEQALKLAPNTPAVMDTVAFSLAAQNQLPKAIEMQLKAVAGAPAEPQFRLQLAKFYVQSGDKPSAREELLRLSKLGATFRRQAEVAEMLKNLGGPASSAAATPAASK